MAQIRIDADAKAAIAEILAFTRAQEGIGAGQDELAKKSKAAAAEERRLAALRKQLVNEHTDGVEKARKKIEDFEKSIQGQAVEEQKLGRIRQRLNDELKAALDEASGETARLAQLEADRQEEIKETASEAAKAAAAQARLLAEEAAAQQKLAATRSRYFDQYERQSDKVRKKLEEFNRSIRGQEVDEKKVAEVRRKLHAEYVEALAKDNAGLIDFKEELEEVEETSSGAFDVGKLARWGAGFLSVQAVIQGALQVIRETRQETDAIGEGLASITGSSGNLVQIAGSNAELRDKLFKASDEIFAQGLVKSREEADRLVFELESAGRLGEIDFFKRVSAIDDAASIAKSVGIVSAGFAGGDAVGSSDQILSKAIAAANPAVGVDAKDIAQAVADVAAVANQFALRDEEVFAAISVIAQQTGSADVAKTNFRQLLVSATRRGLADELRGQGLGSIIQRVSQEGTTDKDLTDFLGDTQGVLGFRQLQDLGRVDQRLREVEIAQRTGLADQTINNAFSSDRIRAAQLRQAAENQAIITRDADAVRELKADVGQTALVEEARRREGDTMATVQNQLTNVQRLVSPFAEGTLGRAADEQRAREDALAQAGVSSRVSAAGVVTPEERQAEIRRQQLAQESKAFAEQERAKEARKEAEKQAKADVAEKNKAAREERQQLAATKRDEAAEARAERERLAEQRDSASFATQSRRTAELAKEAGIGFEPESAIEKYRSKNALESEGRTDTEILRLIAEEMRSQGVESKKQTELLRKRVGTPTR